MTFALDWPSLHGGMFSRRLYRIIPRRLNLIRGAKTQSKKKKVDVAPASAATSTSRKEGSRREVAAGSDSINQNSKTDINELGIPMISADLHRRLFGSNSKVVSFDEDTLKEIRSRIAKAAGVDRKQLSNATNHSGSAEDAAFDLPKLRGKTVEDHFFAIAEEQVGEYRSLAKKLAFCKMPAMPAENCWVMQPGWTKYSDGGSAICVHFPEEDALFFDVEVSCSTKKPTLAVAMSEKSWYSWCSEELCFNKNGPAKFFAGNAVRLEDLIPLESKLGQTDGFERRKKLVIGHNVAFDRSYVKEQHFLERTELRFLDTMSMHIATSGFASVQRATHLKNERVRNGENESRRTEVVGGGAAADGGNEIENDEGLGNVQEGWEKKGSMNSLVAVHEHYCPGSRLNLEKAKATRDIFVHGTLDDVRNKFAESMHYCAQDVVASFEVFSKLLPDFLDRFPHPVTLSGMLEMGTAYLPINETWLHFINAAEESYNAHLGSITDKLLMKLANDAVGLLKDDRYRQDPWLWDEDWSALDTAVFYKKSPAKSKSIKGESPEDYVKRVWDTFAEKARKAQPYLPKFPRWYVALCTRPRSNFETMDEAVSLKAAQGANVTEGWGPQNITMQMRIAPKLLRMHYNGYPLYCHTKHGWGYLVPIEDQKAGRSGAGSEKQSDDLHTVRLRNREAYFPLRRVKEVVAENRQRLGIKSTEMDESSGGKCVCDLPGVTFYKLPHKDGFGSNVGNPLAKDFLHLIEEGKLVSQHPEHAQRLADINRVCSYWKITRDRILDQMAVLFYQFDSAGNIVMSKTKQENGELLYGAIVPRIITSGTVTRRAVEPLWMTASNAKEKRIGSEVRSMVQAPPGYVFVGADVDSQELWIASLLGDSWEHNIHGCSPFSWMLLRGDKASGTDQHSRVAAELGVTRDEAKILNYGRIYGAGLPFATVLLKKFRPNEDAEEIKKLARRLYWKTKGARREYCLLTEEGAKIADEAAEAVSTARLVSSKLKQHFSDRRLEFDQFCAKKWKGWTGGTESEVFNCLERIALSDRAATPVLGCRLSRALELGSDNKGFLPSRVNWVVQSSAVDYLHLMLVCMRWLFDEYKIDGRFSISIHDEVRYLVAEKDKYRAALALQITNLLTRAMFVSKVGMTGLPRSVAFFNKVDIDKALRKEVYMDATTPSNQLGLRGCYRVPHGDALDIRQIVEKTGGGRLDKV